jgi:ATP-binding cassette, subfamily B, bacterial
MQSWRLSIVALITLPPYAWIVLRSSKRLETGLTRYYEMWDSVSSRIQDALGAIKTVKLSGAERREADRLRRQSQQAYDTYVERNRLANRYVFFQTSLNYLSQALVLGYGGWLVFERGLTPGDVVMFVVYLDRLYSPIESLTALSVTLQEHFASMERARKLLELPGERTTGELPHPGPGQVEFRHVHFGYVPGREVLSDVSLVLEAGKLTALVGPSGAGKTTASDLLLRLFEVDSGEIILDGQVLGRMDASAIRRQIGVVAADGAIFRGPIAENICYKRPEATEEEVREAALAAGLGGTLERLPQGLATQIGEGGVGLSVGERQRLQIARALVGRPRVLILDEATANLDYATELGIRHALLCRASHPTTLVITHRYSMAEICDNVIVLQAGRVVAHGTPAQLRASCEWFAQFSASGAAQAESADASSSARDKSSDVAHTDDKMNRADTDEELEDDS